MKRVCRVCRDADVDLVEIFNEQQDNPSLADMFIECTGCEILQNDPLPQQLCKDCAVTLQHFHSFKRKCEQSQLHFWQELTTDIMDSGVTFIPWIKEETLEPQIDNPSGRENDEEEAYEGLIKCDVKLETSSNSSSNQPKDKEFHVCPTCYKQFPSEQKMRHHKHIHDRKRLHKCPQCEKLFPTVGNLADHIRAHTGERPYQCPHCTKAFTQRGRLNEHIRIHTGERPFKCLQCPKTFVSSSNLTVHKRVHNKHPEFICKICSAMFMHPGSLQRHMLSHANGGCCKCPICLMPFTSNAYLKRHMATHAARKEMKCGISC